MCNTKLKAESGKRKAAFTLVELLVSMAISLIMVYAMVRFMTWVGDSVGDGRAMIELSGQLRGVRQRLNDDLASLTVQVRPWADELGAKGYFEINEGVRSDTDRDGDLNRDLATNTSLYGDFDDVIGMTIQAKGEPFFGRYVNNAGTITTETSQVAEVIWFTGYEDRNGNVIPDDGEPRYVYRRQLLIRPDMAPVTLADINAVSQWMRNNDISVNISQASGQYVLRGNSLADLADRKNRWGRQIGSNFPYPIHAAFPVQLLSGAPQNNPYVLTGGTGGGGGGGGGGGSGANNRLGEDIQLSRCIAFDVRVWDPTAPIVSNGTEAVGPSDIVVVPGSPTTVGRGAYVDLRYVRYQAGANSLFSGVPDGRSGLNNFAVYDTWTSFYERDGVNQNVAPNTVLNNLIDEGTDGVDNDGANGVDDVNERETSPPYPFPLRGIQVIIRAYDSDSRQLRQATVVGDFVPE